MQENIYGPDNRVTSAQLGGVYPVLGYLPDVSGARSIGSDMVDAPPPKIWVGNVRTTGDIFSGIQHSRSTLYFQGVGGTFSIELYTKSWYEYPLGRYIGNPWVLKTDTILGYFGSGLLYTGMVWNGYAGSQSYDNPDFDWSTYNGDTRVYTPCSDRDEYISAQGEGEYTVLSASDGEVFFREPSRRTGNDNSGFVRRCYPETYWGGNCLELFRQEDNYYETPTRNVITDKAAWDAQSDETKNGKALVQGLNHAFDHLVTFAEPPDDCFHPLSQTFSPLSSAAIILARDVIPPPPGGGDLYQYDSTLIIGGDIYTDTLPGTAIVTRSIIEGRYYIDVVYTNFLVQDALFEPPASILTGEFHNWESVPTWSVAASIRLGVVTYAKLVNGEWVLTPWYRSPITSNSPRASRTSRYEESFLLWQQGERAKKARRVRWRQTVTYNILLDLYLGKGLPAEWLDLLRLKAPASGYVNRSTPLVITYSDTTSTNSSPGCSETVVTRTVTMKYSVLVNGELVEKRATYVGTKRTIDVTTMVDGQEGMIRSFVYQDWYEPMWYGRGGPHYIGVSLLCDEDRPGAGNSSNRGLGVLWSGSPEDTLTSGGRIYDDGYHRTSTMKSHPTSIALQYRKDIPMNYDEATPPTPRYADSGLCDGQTISVILFGHTDTGLFYGVDLDGTPHAEPKTVRVYGKAKYRYREGELSLVSWTPASKPTGFHEHKGTKILYRDMPSPEEFGENSLILYEGVKWKDVLADSERQVAEIEAYNPFFSELMKT